MVDVPRLDHLWDGQKEHHSNEKVIWCIESSIACDTIYIKTQVFRLLRYYSPAPRNIARSDWATQNITHINNIAPWASFTLIMLHSRKGNFSYALHKPHEQEELQGITHHYFCKVIIYLYISFNRKLWMSR